jgi:two-component system, OmpR family, alkaline phosphatase synthesis response regulator PhoP
MRVLILDDQPRLAEILATSLRHHGYTVKAFTSPLEALKAIRESDVLVTDYHLPGMTGLEMARQAYAQG